MYEETCIWPAHQQVAAIQERKITSRELLERYISRIDALDDKINAVVTRDYEGGRHEADRADAALAQGQDLGALHGLPATIKDALETKGLRSTGGASELATNIPENDAPGVRAIKEAGAYVFGKTNLPPWSGDIQANNDIFGRTNNPWNLEYGPGGSSGGAAAAVAAGMASFDIGTDIGGSIRFPASFCGVFGHKPSFGIVSSSGYLDCPQELRPELDSNVIGPIARSAKDLDLLLTVLLQRNPPLIADLVGAVDDVRTLRVAAWIDDDAARVDRDVLEVMERAIDILESVGRITVDRTARPEFDLGWAADLTKTLLLTAVSAPDHNIDHYEWHELNRERLELRRAWSAFFDRYDVIIMPVCIVPPFRHLEDSKGDMSLFVNGEPRDYFDALRWTTPVGQAFLPSTVAPIGLSRKKLPIGIQIVGPYGADRSTIKFAGYISELCGGYQPPPIAKEL